MHYDYLIVGAGLYGAVFAHEARLHNKSVLVIDKRPNIAGNVSIRITPKYGIISSSSLPSIGLQILR